MGRKTIEVSNFGLRVSAAIRAQQGIRRMSNRELARAIGRSEGYIRARVNDEKEWTLNDLELICNLWGITPGQLIEEAPKLPASSPTALAGEREDIDIDAWADRIREEDGVRAGGGRSGDVA